MVLEFLNCVSIVLLASMSLCIFIMINIIKIETLYKIYRLHHYLIQLIQPSIVAKIISELQDPLTQIAVE